MSSGQIREKFLDFFKGNGHVIVPSSSLIPDDSSVLLTTAGVQQFKGYYTGELDPLKDFGARRVASVQKCFRTSDIESVGDETHLTFFEMLGNFSFGDYFKADAIRWGYEFITKDLGVAPERVSVSIFTGDSEVPRDAESYRVWTEEVGLAKEKIKEAGRADNFWGPTGKEGPCGPTSEIYIDGVEVWNLVFNEYYCGVDGSLRKLDKPGVDTGMGLERLTAVLNGTTDVYKTDPLSNLLGLDPNRIVADHLRGSIFLIADGVRPSNKEAGYILRRLLRRVIALKKDIDPVRNKPPLAAAAVPGAGRISNGVDFVAAVNLIKEKYSQYYPEVVKTKEILEVLEGERAQFLKTLDRGLKKLKEYSTITAKDAFNLYQSYGLPFEVIKEMGGPAAANLLKRDFNREFQKHQEISRARLEKKFGGHGLLLDTGELRAGDEDELKKVTRLHTATHLLQQVLRDVLGETVQQRGSDITAERTRFDFSFSRKLTPEEIRRVEEIVNQKIAEDLPVAFEEMPLAEAQKTGALFFFKQKYPARVKVYFIGGDPSAPRRGSGRAYSAEFCGGPHVRRTSEIGHFKILKEESISAGVRRLRATVE